MQYFQKPGRMAKYDEERKKKEKEENNLKKE